MTPFDPDGSPTTPPAPGEPTSVSSSAPPTTTTGAFGATDVFQTLPPVPSIPADNLADLLRSLSPTSAGMPGTSTSAPPAVASPAPDFLQPAASPALPAAPIPRAASPDLPAAPAQPADAQPSAAPQPPTPVVHEVKFHAPGSGDLGLTDPLHRLLRSTPPLRPQPATQPVPQPTTSAPAAGPLNFTQLLSALTPEQIAAAQATLPQPLAAPPTALVQPPAIAEEPAIPQEPATAAHREAPSESAPGDRTAVFPVFSSPASAAASASFTQLFQQLDANDLPKALAEALQAPSIPIDPPARVEALVASPGIAPSEEAPRQPLPPSEVFPLSAIQNAGSASAASRPAQPSRADLAVGKASAPTQEATAYPSASLSVPAGHGDRASSIAADSPSLPNLSPFSGSHGSPAGGFTELFQAIEAPAEASVAQPASPAPSAAPVAAAAAPNSAGSQVPDPHLPRVLANAASSHDASRTAASPSPGSAGSSFTQLFSALGAGAQPAPTQADPFPPLGPASGRLPGPSPFPGQPLSSVSAWEASAASGSVPTFGSGSGSLSHPNAHSFEGTDSNPASWPHANLPTSNLNPQPLPQNPFPGIMPSAEPFALRPEPGQVSGQAPGGGLTQLLRILDGPPSHGSTFAASTPNPPASVNPASLLPAFPNAAGPSASPNGALSSAFSSAAQPSLGSGFGAFSDAPFPHTTPGAVSPGQTPFGAPTPYPQHDPLDSLAGVANSGATVAFRPPQFPSTAPSAPPPPAGPGEFTRILQASALRESGIGSAPSGQTTPPPTPHAAPLVAPHGAPQHAGSALPPWSMPPVPHMPHLNGGGAAMSPVSLPHTPNLPHAPAFHLPAAAPAPAATPAAKPSMLPIILIAVIVLLVAILVAVLLLKH